MLNRFQAWRERGWTLIDAPAYEQAWQRFGGSVATHPLVVERLAALAEIPVRYLGWEHNGELKAAIPTWGRSLALSKDVLKSHGKKGLFDLGNAELILPAAFDAQVPLRHAGRYLSELNQGRIATLKPQAESLAMARTPEDLSKKFRYNQRRELRLLEEAGIILRRITLLDAKKLGLSLTAMVQIGMDRHTPDRFEAFENEISGYPEVQSCYLITGQDADYLLQVIVPDMDAYQSLLLDRITRIPGVTGVHSSFVMRKIVDRQTLPLTYW